MGSPQPHQGRHSTASLLNTEYRSFAMKQILAGRQCLRRVSEGRSSIPCGIHYLLMDVSLAGSSVRSALNGQKDVAGLGQVFTPSWLVEEMLALRRNEGSVLEPSAGDGSFMRKLEPSAVGIEIDIAYRGDRRVRAEDFFCHDRGNLYDTIIGNPPYVRFQDIRPETKQRLPAGVFDCRSNLYLFFVWKAIDHLALGGELIFVTPRDFLKATSASALNRRLYKEGSFTHFRELGDQRVFAGFSPNCAVWRWVKGRKTRQTEDGAVFSHSAGQIWFGQPARGRIGDFFEVKVGAVSGADRIFADADKGCTDFVCSRTGMTGEKRRMIYNRYDPALEAHKQSLLARRVRKFGESNWWEWGRLFPRREGERIYVNARTRHSEPFFVCDTQAFDGSVLALFPREELDLNEAASRLNGTSWEDLGFVCDGRLMFTQRSLECAPVSLE